MKKIFSACAVASFVILMFSCSGTVKNSDNGFFNQDFDNLKMWSGDPAITNERAHSGTYSTFTDSTHMYSQTFQMNLGYARSKGYKYLLASGWCFMTHENTKAGFIVSIENQEKAWKYQSSDFSSFLKTPDTWGKAMQSVKLPEDAPADANIKIYIWSPNKEKTFLDDVEIQFTK